MKLGLATLCLVLAACGGAEETQIEQPSAKQDPHAHDGPNGGHVVALGSEGLLEVKVDHTAGTVTIWIFKDREFGETLPLDEEPVFNFVAGKGPVQMTGEEYDDGWIFWDDEVLKDEFKTARFRVKLKGKTFQPPFVHGHEQPAASPAGASEGG